MQFSFATVLAFATAVFAQQRAALPNPAFNPVTSPTTHQEVVAGSTLTIKWTVAPQFASTKVNLILIGGPEQNTQTPLLRIVDGLDNSLGEYAWTIPADQGGFPWYGITFEDVADTFNNYQFSPPFDILKNADASSSAAYPAPTSTVTITTASGTATVILSSAVPTTTEVSSSVKPTSTKASSSEIKTTSVVVSSSAAPVPTLVTVTSSVAIVAASSTSSVPAAQSSAVLVGENAGAQAKAGLFAVVGGLAVALML